MPLRLSPTSLIAVVVAAGLSVAAPAAAQQRLSPDQLGSSPERQQGEVSDGEPVDDQTGEDEEEEDDAAGESAFPTFDEVEVQRVRPDQVPDYRPGLPEGSTRRDSAEMPGTLEDRDLEELSRKVASSTVEILAVKTPPEPYRSTKMLFRGHALWISPHHSGEDPRLVATADWLREADSIYAIDGEVGRALSNGGIELGDTDPQPVEELSADASTLIARYRDRMVALEIDEASRHVNLARLSGADGIRVTTPDRGLVLHDVDEAMPAAVFGFSPGIGTTVVPTSYQDSSQLEREYSFYFLVSFGAILGAPLVGPNGRLVGMTALRYPSNPDQTLAIPPGAIHAFLGTGRAGGDADDE